MALHKVLFTASTASHICNFHLPYLEYFQKQGWTVHVACGGAMKPIPYTDQVFSLPLRKKMQSPDNFRAALQLRQIIKQEQYDFISVHTSLAAFFTRLALRGLRKRPPVVNMVHGYLFDDETPFFKRQILLSAEKVTAPQTDLLLTMNQWDFDLATRYHLGRRVVHIPGIGVDFSRLSTVSMGDAQVLRKTYGVSEDAFVLLYAAEFSKRKGQTILIQAIKSLPSHVVLVLAGDGILLKDCKTLVEQLGLTNRVVFPGYVQEMGQWYQTADAVVSSSRSEGLPFNIMEAMYMEKPVVASAVKGHTDLIQDHVNGLLYPFGDAEACARQIQTLIDSPSLRRLYGQRAKTNVVQYQLSTVFPQVIAQYQSLLPTERITVNA